MSNRKPDFRTCCREVAEKMHPNQTDEWKKIFMALMHSPETEQAAQLYADRCVEEAMRLLRDLADLQNGPPLEQHREEWQATMNEVYSFLSQHESDQTQQP